MRHPPNMENIFYKELHRELKPFLKQTRSKRVRANMRLSLHGMADQTMPIKGKITQLEDFLSDILYNYAELSESLKRFKVISVLIKQYPELSSWSSAGINKTVYLRYHYESFLNEAYLFRERMCILLNDIKKKCKKQSFSDHATFIEKVKKDFLNALETVSSVRGRHVHMRRHKDRKIEQLADLELFVDIPYYKLLRDKEYKLVRLTYSKEIAKFGEDLEELQNQTLSRILKLTFIDLLNKYK